MLKLRLNNTASSWLPVAGGVRVLIPPCGTAVLRAAEHAAGRAYAAARDALGVQDGEQLSDDQVSDLEGIFAQARIRALAGRIEEWEGIAGEDGQPMSLSPEALDAFAAHPALGAPFARAYEVASVEVVKEGNGSAPSGDGTRRGAKPTAEAAPDAA